MTVLSIISILLSIVLIALFWYTDKANRQAHSELLKRIPATEDSPSSPKVQPLTIEKIADSIRMEGYFPEILGDAVSFKVQGEGYYVDTGRFPMLFIAKSFSVDPTAMEMDLLKDAAHRMSDDLVMVKTTISEEDKALNFFVAALDRNYESFRANFAFYLSLLMDGQRKMSEEYNRLVEKKQGSALKDETVGSSIQHDNKVFS